MKNVWKGMLLGAFVGAGLDVGASIGRGSTELASSAAQNIHDSDLPDKARAALSEAKSAIDDFAHSDNVAKAKDALVHVADATRNKVGDISTTQ